MQETADKLSQLLAECEYFKVTKEDIHGQSGLFADEKSFNHILVTDGDGVLVCGDEDFTLKKGASIFVPANTGAYKIKGNCSIIITEI